MTIGLVQIIDREILKQKNHIEAVGMDLDGNLTDLHRQEIYELMWENMLGFLPEHLRKKLQRYTFEDINKTGNIKVGWFLDMMLGYTVVTDIYGRILAVKKGNERLERRKMFKVYGASGVIDTSQSLNPDHVKPRFLPYCDGYDFLEGVIKTAIAAMGGHPLESTINQVDIAWFQAHHSEDGFKKYLMEKPQKYGIKPNKELKDFLDKLNQRYITFLLTNSHQDYAIRILDTLEITNFFDLIIADAKKPACFSPTQHEYRALWSKLFELGIKDPGKVFYIGDHLYKEVILPRQAGVLTGLRMKRVDIVEISRKLSKYAGITFQIEGNLVVPRNNANPTQLGQLNNFLSQLYRHAQVLTTKVQNLEPILLY